MTTTTYTVSVTPRFEGLTPKYDALVYVNRTAGVCGPFSEDHSCDSLDEVDEWLLAQGFVRSDEFGPVCSNGFADAPLTRDFDNAARLVQQALKAQAAR